MLPTSARLPSNPVSPCSLWSLPKATSIHLATSPRFHSHNNSIPTKIQPTMLAMPSSATCHSLRNLKDASLRISNVKPAYSTGIHHPVGLFCISLHNQNSTQKHSVSHKKARAQPQYLMYLSPSPFHYLFSSFLPPPRYEPPLSPCQSPKPRRKSGGVWCSKHYSVCFFCGEEHTSKIEILV